MGKGTETRINMDSTLKDLYAKITNDRNTGRMQKRGASSRVLGMLGYLSSPNPCNLVPRKMKTVSELYSIPQDEFQKFKLYKKQTWSKLDKILTSYGLPQLNLPEEYRDNSV